MARGNDSEAAKADLQKHYGDQPNAEVLIAEHKSVQDPRLHRASLSGIDQGATNALDLEGLGKNLGEGERVMAASVRQGYVVAVVEDARGNYTKRLMDLPKAAKEKSSVQVPVEGPKQVVDEPKPVSEDAKPKTESPGTEPKSNPAQTGGKGN